MRRAHVVAIAWTLLIVAACTIPGKDLPKVNIGVADKLAHLAMFFGYGWLWMTALAAPLLKRSFIVGISGLLLAIGSELYQGILPWERSPDPFDALANAAGLAVSVVFYTVWLNRRHAT